MAAEGIKVRMAPPHPGRFIRAEVVDDLGLDVAEAAEILGVRQAALSDLLTEQAALSPDMAKRVEKAFGVGSDLLLRLQAWYDASQSQAPTEAMPDLKGKLAEEVANTSFRRRVAKTWREGTYLSRSEIFGPGDGLRPTYKNVNLDWQLDVPAVGLVGKHYEPGGLVLISVNPAGGKDEYASSPHSDLVYERYLDLRELDDVHLLFEESNNALLASMPNWRFTKRRVSEVLKSAGKGLNEIAFLYVVPFRTKGDGGSNMNPKYIQNGYANHLKAQLNAVSPGHIIALDKPSKEAAAAYKKESCSGVEVIYVTGRRNGHAERQESLEAIRREFRLTSRTH